MNIPFIKMQGLGNDFIILDQRTHPIDIAKLDIAKLCHRDEGIGCDQLIVLEDSDHAPIKMNIYNADGSKVAACGNATRCVGKLLLEETGAAETQIETDAGMLNASAKGDVSSNHAQITVLLAPPALEWEGIPLSKAVDTLHLPIKLEAHEAPCAVSIGNPHMVFFVEDVQAVPLAGIGEALENHPLFPERTNVEFVQIDAPDRLTMRVWERGAGITQACGTGACASLVAAARRGLSARKATVTMPGGSLQIEWLDEKQGNRIKMMGDAQEDYRRTFDFSDFLA